jgi:SOS response regulatory protein OraA/RecX
VTSPEGKPLELAAAALARRDLSPAALAAKLEAHGIETAEAADAVERLRAAGYVDEGRFARDRAESLAGRGWGDAGIRHDLERQGCTDDAVQAALASLEPERERARGLVARLGAGPRTARRLAAKGFAYESLEAALH